MATEYTGTYTKVTADAFKHLQLNAGILLKNFTPATPAVVQDSDIICSTSGGVNATCVPTFTDFAEDVDNVPANILEYKQISSWECKMSFTALDVSSEVIKLALGAADVSGTKVTPRKTLKSTDAADIWWVGDMNDGGFAAICLKNALGTGGLSLQTGKEEKGKLSVELTGHIKLAAQDVVPMEFYVIAGKA